MAIALKRVTTVALATFAGALLTSAPAAAKGGPFEIGDAPDGRSAGYSGASAGVLGAFPSTLASGGPRHSGWRRLRIGPRADGETDSHQVDRDRYDDGAEATLRRCKASSRLTLGLNGRRLPRPQRAKGNLIYVNAWFDWNRDGDWEDGYDGCAHEWAIRNLAVPAASLGRDGLRLLPVAFKAGKQTRELWWRVTVTLNQPLSAPGGRGAAAPFSFGETEDHFQGLGGGEPIFEEEEPKEKKKPKLGASCNPFVAVIPHGGTARVGFNINAPGKGGPVYGAWRSPRKGKDWRAGLIRSKNQRGLPAGKVRAVGFAVKSTGVDPPQRFQFLTFKFVFWRGKTVRRFECHVLVIHEGGHGKGKRHKHGKHQHAPKIPPVRCKGPCAEGYPNPPITPIPPDNEPQDRPKAIGIIGMVVAEGEAQAKGAGGTPNVEFHVEFQVASELDQFLLVFDPPYQVKEGMAQVGLVTNFECDPGKFEGKSALVCNGPVQPNELIEGMLMLEKENAPPDIYKQMELVGAGGGKVYPGFSVGPLL